MGLIIRQARSADVPRIIALFTQDQADAILEAANMGVYEAAFDAIEAERDNGLFVGERDGRVVASYQLTFISRLSDHGRRQAVLADLQIAPDLAGQGLEERLLDDAKSRARAARCKVIQIVAQPEDAITGVIETAGFTALGTSYTQRLD